MLHLQHRVYQILSMHARNSLFIQLTGPIRMIVHESGLEKTSALPCLFQRFLPYPLTSFQVASWM